MTIMPQYAYVPMRVQVKEEGLHYLVDRTHHTAFDERPKNADSMPIAGSDDGKVSLYKADSSGSHTYLHWRPWVGEMET